MEKGVFLSKLLAIEDINIHLLRLFDVMQELLSE